MTQSQLTERSPGLLRVHAWLVMLAVLVTVGAAGAITALQEVTVTATAKVLALGTPTSAGTPMAPDMGTEREVALSGEVADLAAEDLRIDASQALEGLSVSVVTDTHVLTFSYTASDVPQAVAGAQAFTRAYVEYRNSAQTARAARIITEPEVSGGRSGVSWQVMLVVAVAVGLALGAAAAWSWDRMSGRVRTRAELAATGIPIVTTLGEGPEGFGHLAARLTAMTEGRRHGLQIVVTGTDRLSETGDIALRTAMALAALGRRVVLVDADLRRAELTARTGLASSPGLPEVLTGGCNLENAVRATSVEGLSIVPTSVVTPPPLDLDQVRLVFGQLTSRSIVVVSAPPLPDAPEAALIAENANAVLLVTRLGHSRRSAVAKSVSILEPEAAHRERQPITGWVVCAPDHQPSDALKARAGGTEPDQGVTSFESPVGSPP